MYTILRVYDDLSAVTEKTCDFCSALRACEIALLDPLCCSVKIWSTNSGKLILDYDR